MTKDDIFVAAIVVILPFVLVGSIIMLQALNAIGSSTASRTSYHFAETHKGGIVNKCSECKLRIYGGLNAEGNCSGKYYQCYNCEFSPYHVECLSDADIVFVGGEDD